MLLLSIIIPVFNNTEKDIERCVKSLHNKCEYNNAYEILLIDDGSCNECARVLDDIGTEFSNIRVFHQMNQGVSSARNLGIRASRGKYVAFVDADDVVTTNFICDAIWAINHAELDIIYGYIKYISDNTLDNNYGEKEVIHCNVLSEQKKKELYCHFFDLSQSAFWCGEHYISRGPVARLVRKKLARHNLFDETLCKGEDVVWNLQVLKNSNNVGVINRLWYYYIKNDLSATQVFDAGSINQYENMLRRLLLYATDDVTKAHLLNKTILDACELAKGFFLSGHYSGGFSAATFEFNKMFSRMPWNSVLKFSYAYTAGWKCCVKYLLIKAGLLLMVVKLKMIIRK